MSRKILSLFLLFGLLLTLLAGCAEEKAALKIAMVTDGNAVSDNHLNNPVWYALQDLSDAYELEYGFYRPNSNTTEAFMQGVDDLVAQNFNVIVFPGVLFTETFVQACAKYPNTYFIAIDCNPESVPANGATAVFDKSQAGFLAGYAAALELGDTRFGGVFGSGDADMYELLCGFLQGIRHAEGSASSAETDFVFLDSRTSYPAGQQTAATLYESGVRCMLTSSDPTGMGALAETRVRRQAGEDVWAVCSDADGFITASYDNEGKLSACLTTALCDYGKPAFELIEKLVEGDTSFLGRATVYDLTSGGVGLPEEAPNLSEDTVKACEKAAEAIKDGSIVITVQ